jgi:DNA-binding transcriptional ArsR family regulator
MDTPPDDLETISRVSRALAVETRVRLIALLRGGPLCVGALASRLDVSQSAVSQHLRVLREAGLVSPDRRGYYTHYRLNEAALETFSGLMEQLLPGSRGQTAKIKRKEGGDKSCPRRKPSAKSRRN